ncbi:MAG: RHS repeat-associated core domain-containing protein [Pseudomonadota bacterium]|nr:RHS repeat-associated core domain-containing protein [Pseudomonadota bacterium]
MRATDAPPLIYNYFRDYDPSTGRYIQSDPIGLEGGTNAYTCVQNDPIQAVDPQGLYGYWPADRTRRTVVCDGRGGVVPQLPPLPDPYQKCLGDCVRQHEISHIVDLRRAGPGLCKGQPRGVRPTLDTIEDLNRSERRAYDAIRRSANLQLLQGLRPEHG